MHTKKKCCIVLWADRNSLGYFFIETHKLMRKHFSPLYLMRNLLSFHICMSKYMYKRKELCQHSISHLQTAISQLTTFVRITLISRCSHNSLLWEMFHQRCANKQSLSHGWLLSLNWKDNRRARNANAKEIMTRLPGTRRTSQPIHVLTPLPPHSIHPSVSLAATVSIRSCCFKVFRNNQLRQRDSRGIAEEREREGEREESKSEEEVLQLCCNWKRQWLLSMPVAILSS